MRFSKKTDYALRALMSLVEHQGKGPISINDLAQKNDIPKRFLEHIMLDLKEQGWVKSIPGRHGGYALDKAPEEITIGQIVRQFDGVLAPIGCVSVSQYEPCSQEAACRFRRVLLDVRNITARILDKASLASVYQGLPVTNDEVLAELLTDKVLS